MPENQSEDQPIDETIVQGNIRSVASQTEVDLDYKTVINQMNEVLKNANDEIYRNREKIKNLSLN